MPRFEPLALRSELACEQVVVLCANRVQLAGHHSFMHVRIIALLPAASETGCCQIFMSAGISSIRPGCASYKVTGLQCRVYRCDR